MAALAGMLQARGHKVTGSDENVYPPMSTMLASLGISVMQGYKAGHLEPQPDCIIVGNAIPRGNTEVEATLNQKLLYRSQAEVVKGRIHSRPPLAGCCRDPWQDHDYEHRRLGAGSGRP